MDDSKQAFTQATGAGQATENRVSDDAAGLAFDIDEQPVLSRGHQRLTERTDLPIAGLPRPEPRKIPLWARLRLAWHRQILRDAR